MFRHLVALAAVAAILCTAPPSGLGAEAGGSVKALDAWSGIFGGRRATFRFAATAPRAFRGRAGWSLGAHRRAIARGEIAVAVDPRQAARFAIRIDVPAVKEGVVMPVALSVALYAPGRAAPEATLEKRLWVFPEDPFAHRKHWLKQLGIHLFDPEDKTRQVLEHARVPFTQTPNVDALGEITAGVLVVGEGTSFDDYRGLPEAMARAASRGVAVVCLAPSGGQFPVPGTEEAELPKPERIVLRRANIVRELDKRLDADGWPPDGKMLASTLTVRSDRGRVIAEAVESGAGWPWLEARFAAKRGMLVVCGFGIISKWDAGPTPRFLFARLLDHVSAGRQPALHAP